MDDEDTPTEIALQSPESDRWLTGKAADREDIPLGKPLHDESDNENVNNVFGEADPPPPPREHVLSPVKLSSPVKISPPANHRSDIFAASGVAGSSANWQTLQGDLGAMWATTGSSRESTPTSPDVDSRVAKQMGETGQSVQGSPQAFSHVVFRIGTQLFNLSKAVVQTESFRSSRLGELVFTGNAQNIRCNAHRNNVGEFVVNRDMTNFELLVDHLMGGKPLETLGFSSVCQTYKKLVDEMVFWGFDPCGASLPTRLWTRTRWTDLMGFYTQSTADSTLLAMRPVAVQLLDGTIQGIRVLDRMNINSQEVQKRLPPEVCLSQLVAVYSWGDYSITLCDRDRPEIPNEYLRSSGGSDRSPVRGGTTSPTDPIHWSSASAFELPLQSHFAKSSGLGSQKLGNSSQSYSESLGLLPRRIGDIADEILLPAAVNITSIFIAIPNCSKICVFEIPRHIKLELPAKGYYPHLYRRSDRLYVWLSSKFGLELHELRDGTSEISKVRCCFVSAKSAPSAASYLVTQKSDVSSSSSSWASSVRASTSTSSQAKTELQWQCFHPTLACRYGSSTRWVRDLGEFGKVRLFPWGAMFVQHRVENPFAVLSIEDPAFRKIYGEKLAVYIRGLPEKHDRYEKQLPRDMLDISATSNLDRVYLICCNQLASVAVTPNSPKLEFEIVQCKEEGRRYVFKYVHLDIADGAPCGPSLGSLHCLGMLSEFDVTTGLYTQNELCAAMCPKYTKLLEG